MSTHYKALTRRTNPETIALFPLNGAVLFPGCELPLNVFEPRYLNMIDDALKKDRLIGMVQNGDDDTLSAIGGLGRIIQFSEMDDGRYLIVLKGLKRFRIVKELETVTPYRQAKISFDEFSGDANVHDTKNMPEAFLDKGGSDRAALTIAMKTLAKSLGVKIDWKTLADIPLPNLVDQAAMISPFKPQDKQSLLEATSTEDRRRLLIGLMHLYATVPNGDNNRPVQ